MWTAPAASTSAKRRTRRSFKELMLRRRHKSHDDEPSGVLFERDLDEICQRGTLPPSLTVSNAQCHSTTRHSDYLAIVYMNIYIYIYSLLGKSSETL